MLLEGWWRRCQEGVGESKRPCKQTGSEGEEQYVRIGPPNPGSHRQEYDREFPFLLLSRPQATPVLRILGSKKNDCPLVRCQQLF